MVQQIMLLVELMPLVVVVVVALQWTVVVILVEQAKVKMVVPV
jgi:hypothetical protein